MKRLLLLLTVAGLLAIPQTAQAATAGNLDGRWTYPSSVKLPSGNCGTFKVSFTLGLRAKAADKNISTTFYVVNSDGDLIAAAVASVDSGALDDMFDSGTISGNTYTEKVKFCKKAWQNEYGDVLAGATPGSKRVEISMSVGAEYFKAVTIRFS